MRTYKVELTFSEACKVESEIRHTAKTYRGFLLDALKRNDKKSAEVWQSTLNEYNSILSKVQSVIAL